MNKKQREAMMETARATGAVGPRALVPKLVPRYASKSSWILDFGAGRVPAHALALTKKGYTKVRFYDIHCGNSPVDRKALSRRYVLVYSSNVLNVQPSLAGLKRTLNQIVKLVQRDGRFLANYPKSPRPAKLPWRTVYGELIKRFETVKRVGGTAEAPIWLSSKPRKKTLKEAPMPKKPRKSRQNPHEAALLEAEYGPHLSHRNAPKIRKGDRVTILSEPRAVNAKVTRIIGTMGRGAYRGEYAQVEYSVTDLVSGKLKSKRRHTQPFLLSELRPVGTKGASRGNPSPPRFREGDRVVFAPDFVDMLRTGLPSPGTEGTVAKVAGFRGRSVYPDPLKSMVFVEWDSGEGVGVSRHSAEKVKKGRRNPVEFSGQGFPVMGNIGRVPKKIDFDKLMRSVKYHSRMKKPYVLSWAGRAFSFKDMADVVPFVEREFGVQVVQRNPSAYSGQGFPVMGNPKRRRNFGAPAWWVGVPKEGEPSVFWSDDRPSKRTHGKFYQNVLGPFYDKGQAEGYKKGIS